MRPLWSVNYLSVCRCLSKQILSSLNKGYTFLATYFLGLLMVSHSRCRRNLSSISAAASALVFNAVSDKNWIERLRPIHNTSVDDIFCANIKLRVVPKNSKLHEPHLQRPGYTEELMGCHLVPPPEHIQRPAWQHPPFLSSKSIILCELLIGRTNVINGWYSERDRTRVVLLKWSPREMYTCGGKARNRKASF